MIVNPNPFAQCRESAMIRGYLRGAHVKPNNWGDEPGLGLGTLTFLSGSTSCLKCPGNHVYGTGYVISFQPWVSISCRVVDDVVHGVVGKHLRFPHQVTDEIERIHENFGEFSEEVVVLNFQFDGHGAVHVI